MADLGYGERIYLIGLMGSGKTTIGVRLAQSLGWEFTDLDQVIETLAGQSISQIFKDQGESEFRRVESQALEQTAHLLRHIIACGGGVTTRKANVDFLRQATTIWLDIDPATAASRLSTSHQRPLLQGLAEPAHRLQQLLNERVDGYGHAAELKVNANRADPEGIAAEIIQQLENNHA